MSETPNNLESTIPSDPLTPEIKEYLNKRVVELQGAKTKNSDLFETQFNYIAGGALAASTFIVDKLVVIPKAHCKIFLYLAWSLLIIALLINLLCALISTKILSTEIFDIEKALSKQGGYDSNNANRKLRVIPVLNYIATGSLIVGISFFFIFVANNLSR